MKKLAPLFLLLVIGFTSFAQDQPEVAPEKNVLKVNTLALIIRTGSVFYERKFSDAMSGQLGMTYLNYKVNDVRLKGLTVTPEVRFYVRNNAIDGFYVGPYLRYNNYSFDDNENESAGKYTAFGGGVAFGRQWIFKKGFVLDLFFGGHYTGSNFEITSGTSEPDLATVEGFNIRTGLLLGFAF